jgi:hypothetical protein
MGIVEPDLTMYAARRQTEIGPHASHREHNPYTP